MKLGFEAKLYVKAGGVDGGGDWTEVDLARDVTTNVTKTQADGSSRASSWKRFRGGQKDASVEFDMIWNSGDDAFGIIQSAFFNDTVVGVRVFDEADGEGIEGDFEIFDFSRGEPLDDVMTVSVTAKPSALGDPPQWIDGSASSSGS